MRKQVHQVFRLMRKRVNQVFRLLRDQTTTKSSGTQAEPRVNTKGTQATEGKSEEIEQLKRDSELEKQALIDRQEKKIEQIRKQVMAEAETAHDMKKQE